MNCRNFTALYRVNIEELVSSGYEFNYSYNLANGTENSFDFGEYDPAFWNEPFQGIGTLEYSGKLTLESIEKIGKMGTRGLIPNMSFKYDLTSKTFKTSITNVQDRIFNCTLDESIEPGNILKFYNGQNLFVSVR